MERVLIITDSNAGISQVEAKQLGIKIVPMPFIINGEEYYEDINLSQEEFYQKLSNENASVSTSQPSTYYLRETWDEALENYEEVLYIPMSSGLSASQANAQAQSVYYNGKVQVVDNQRISVTMKESVFEAIELKKQGKMVISIAHTQNYEEAEKFKEDVLRMIPGVQIRFVDPLSLSVSCHIGPGALAIACCIKNY